VLSLAKGTADRIAETSIIVENTPVKRALIDTGAAVTTINKDLVDSLNLTVETANCRHSVVAANNELIPIKGYVDITIKLAVTPIRLYALYVPEISFPLIVGTNVLRTLGTQVVCEGRVLWPPSATYNVRMS